jgi:hypothetical protein
MVRCLDSVEGEVSIGGGCGEGGSGVDLGHLGVEMDGGGGGMGGVGDILMEGFQDLVPGDTEDGKGGPIVIIESVGLEGVLDVGLFVVGIASTDDEMFVVGESELFDGVFTKGLMTVSVGAILLLELGEGLFDLALRVYRGGIMGMGCGGLIGDLEFLEETEEETVFVFTSDPGPDGDIGPMEGDGTHTPTKTVGLFQEEDTGVEVGLGGVSRGSALEKTVDGIETGDTSSDDDNIVNIGGGGLGGGLGHEFGGWSLY